MVYVITQYSKQQAKKLGVEIKVSSNPKKKIDVFKNGEKISSIGQIGYTDYATTKDKEKRRLYRLRHKGEEKKVGSAGYFAWKILW
jgi:hypothetical protein